MKKVISILLLLSMLVCMIPAVSLTSYAEENPTIKPDISWYTYSPSENKTFYLYDAADLLGLAQIMSVNSTTIDGTQVKPNAKRFNDYRADPYTHTFILMNDIDLNPGWDASSSDEAPANVWPTSSVAFEFQGVIDGNGHTIKGIYFDNSCNGVGIFGQINGRKAEIKNLTIENSYYSSNQANSGFLFGYAADVPTIKFSNVYVEAIMSQKVSEGYMGGFIGYNNASNASTNIEIEKCVFDGNIKSEYSANTLNCGIGGFIAGSNSNSTNISITNSASYMNVDVSAVTDERVFVGALVGVNMGAAIEFSNCVASVNSTVTGNKVCVGALAGGSRYANTASAKYNFTGECYYTGDTPVGCTFKNATPYTYVTSGDAYNTSATNVATNAKKPANNQTLSDAVSSWEGWSANGNKPMPTEVLDMLTTPVAEIVGYQATDEEDGKFNFRIVGVLNVEEDDLANTVLSISATATYTLDGEKTLTLENYPINTVYTSIDGNSDTGLVTYTAKELGGNYIFVLPCKNVPANATDIKVEITVTYTVNAGNGIATRTLYVEAPKDAVN